MKLDETTSEVATISGGASINQGYKTDDSKSKENIANGVGDGKENHDNVLA